MNRWLKRYDSDLFAKQTAHGRVDVCRKVSGIDKALRFSPEQPPESQYIFSLTDDWKITGTPVDRGHMPILAHLQWLDCWRDDAAFDRMVQNRERETKLARRRFKNEIRARAADLRKDFAKATNDIRLGD